MNETELRALQLTQQAVLGLINDVAGRAEKERTKEFMTAGEVADALRMSRSRFYHVYTQAGLIPEKRFGRKLLFRRIEVMQLLCRPEPKRGRPPNRSRLSAIPPPYHEGTNPGLQA